MGAPDVMPGDAGSQAPEPSGEPSGPSPERRSAVLRSTAAGDWEGVDARRYSRSDGAAPDDRWAAVTRKLLAGGPDSTSSFELRYFEVAPGGQTSHERHQHEHAVVVLRGQGEVMLGNELHAIGPGDLVRVAPGDAHQFRNSGPEPFGFLCVVDSERDRPRPVDEADDAPSCDLPG